MTWHKRNIAILFLMCCTICFTESRYRDKDRKRGDKSGTSSSGISGLYSEYILTSTLSTINLCSREREKKLLCYCSPDDFTTPPIKADCWIFRKDFLQNDSTWMAFQHERSLKHLRFVVQETGYMDYVPTKYLEYLTNLTSLSIEYSQIVHLKSNAFANLPNLDLIKLTNNQIEMIDREAFSNHVLLKELNLMRNQIIEIDRKAFHNLPELERLFLSINNISILHEDVFGELGKLIELKLDSNLVSVLTRDMFKGLGNLKSLKLSRNSLNFVGDTVFAELWSLQELELDDNRIERISERALDGLNNLKTLNLRNNRLKKLDNGVFRGVPALLSINLQENHLETLTHYNIQPIIDNLVNNTSELSVSDNKFVCDCRLSWVFDLRNRTRNTSMRKSLESIECFLSRKDRMSPMTHEILTNAIRERKIHSNYGGPGGVHVIGGHGGNHHDIDIDNNESTYDSQVNYYDDEAQYDGINQGQGHIVDLMKFSPESLPCPEALSDPTELPLSRESIGMDVRTTLQSSSSTQNRLWLMSTTQLPTVMVSLLAAVGYYIILIL